MVSLERCMLSTRAARAAVVACEACFVNFTVFLPASSSSDSSASAFSAFLVARPFLVFLRGGASLVEDLGFLFEGLLVGGSLFLGCGGTASDISTSVSG
ncbi:hypothetical protein B0H11DRAFT_2002984 [Mycena galericulata]|nr:hypothetical protein B0H11DRAFT_2002984 [Mycena galericulata]